MPSLIDSPWYYKLENHRVSYGSAIFIAGMIFFGMAGHDIDIVRGIAQGYYDANAAHDIYLDNVNHADLPLVWTLAVISMFVGIAYMVLVSWAHRRIARD